MSALFGRLRVWVYAAVLPAASIWSCAADEHRRMGKTYLADGDYERAVQVAREALTKDPQHPRYLDLLSDAQTAAADHYHEQAELLAQDKRPVAALEKLDKALEHMPAHPGANRLRVQVDRAVQQNLLLANQAREAQDRRDWEQAILFAQQACATDRDDLLSRALLERAQADRAAEQMLASAASDEAAEQGSVALVRIGEPGAGEDGGSASAVAAEGDEPGQTRDGDRVVAMGEVASPETAVADAATSREGPASAEVPRASGSRSTGPLIEVQRTPPAPSLARSAGTGGGRRVEPRLITSEAGGSLTGAAQVNSPASAGLPGATFWTAPQPGEPATVSAAPRPGRIFDGRTITYTGVAPTGRDWRSQEPRAGTPAAAASTPAVGDAKPESAPRATHLFRGALSRDDRRYKKQLAVLDGITIKLKDTSRKPLEADVEIISGKSKSRHKKVPVGGRVEMRGLSGRTYVMTVVWIDHDQETVHFSLDRLN